MFRAAIPREICERLLLSERTPLQTLSSEFPGILVSLLFTKKEVHYRSFHNFSEIFKTPLRNLV